MSKTGNRAPDKSPKLRGSLLRELHKINARIRNLVDLSQINLQNPNSQWVTHKINLPDGIFANIRLTGPFADIYDIHLHYQATGTPIRDETIPSYVRLPRVGIPFSLEWVVNKGNKTVYHRESGPAVIQIRPGVSHHIQEVAYWEWGERHCLHGPARTYLKDHRLRWEWWLRGVQQTPSELKATLSNLHRVPKKEQMYLKLLHSRD